MYLLFFLAVMRIFALQFFWMISDLLAAFIVYCAYSSKGKFMAIFSLINGVFGIIYAITLAPIELSRFKTMNSSPSNGKSALSNSSSLDSSQNNLDNLNNDPNFLGNYNSYSSSNSSMNYFFTMMVINLILALITYTLITYYSYKAFHIFGSPFGNIDNGPQDNYNDYGGTGFTGNRDRERDYNYNNRARNGGFVAFSGRSQTAWGGGSN